MGVSRVGNTGILAPLELGTKNQYFLNFVEDLKKLNSDESIQFLHWQYSYWYETHIAQQRGSLSWCHAVMSVQFTRVRNFSLREGP